MPAGVLTPSAQLLAPLPSISVDQLMQDTIPDAWKGDQTDAYALSTALSAKATRPLPQIVIRRAIDDALKVRWIEIAAESVQWPCDMAVASNALLRIPKTGGFEEGKPDGRGADIESIVFSQDGMTLAFGTYEGMIGIETQDENSNGTVRTRAQSGSVQRLSFSADGDWLISATYSSVRIWPTRTHELLKLLGDPIGRQPDPYELQFYFGDEAARLPTALPEPGRN